MAKKKKTQLKPVARGFATTSIPKKVVQVEEAEPPANEPPASAGSMAEIVTSGEMSGGPQAPTQDTPPDEFDADRVEEQSLQNMIEKFQEKTEKEISRAIKAIGVDRDASKGLTTLQVDPVLVDQVLQLQLQEETSEVQRYIDQTEEKAATRLAITYGVLRRLGFTEDWVEQCLRAIHGVELDEALEWLFVHCPDSELKINEGYKVSKPQNRRKPGTPVLTQEHPATSVESRSPTPLKLDANAPAFLPSFNSTSVNQTPPPQRALASVNTSAQSSKPSSPEPEDLNMEYARIKMQLMDLKTSKTLSEDQKSDASGLFEEKLRNLKSHYFFDERDAERLFRSERDKANAQLLQVKLRGSAELPQPKNPVLKSIPVISAPSPESQSDVFDQEDDESGGLLEILDTIPSEIQGVEGTTIRVKDMPFPKQSAGKLPKAILVEYISKIDRYAAVAFDVLSGASRAKRAGVRVLWEGRKVDEWRMEDVACHDESQAEQYIATVALHALSFPTTEGFAAGSMTSPVGNTFFRLFPPVFRQLWDELEADRKLREDRVNREVWAKLRSIVEQKIDVTRSASEMMLNSALDVKDTSYTRTLLRNAEFPVSPQQFITDFRSRQMRPAYQEMLTHRNSLPIAKYREEIITTLGSSQILVLCGETGCGKSTQVPAFILEDHLSRGEPCKIYCTEPRRISAVSLAQRVSRELGDPPGAVGTLSSLVGYSIRLESNTTKNTRLTYITNGIALRMLEGGSGRGGQGTAFDEITHIMIDEVHERSIESDFLLVVLKSLLSQRPDLRIILMSATVDAEKLSNFFEGCPVLHVPGRTFPVDTLYLEDAIQCTGWSICEDSPYAKRRRDKYHQNKGRTDWDEPTFIDEDEDDPLVDGEAPVGVPITLAKRYSSHTEKTVELLNERVIPYELILRLLEHLCFEDKSLHSFSSAVLIFMPGLAEIRRLGDLLSEHPSFGDESWFRVYPLHSMFSSDDQNAVFDTPPAGMRKIVIATNIAETGITIPDITCVIDTGKQREMKFDEKRQLSRLVETFVAKSNAAQRRGRAGRVQHGVCFHLFTKQRHDTLLAEHPLPEMMRLSLSDLALRIKTMKVKIGTSIEDVLCRALDPPTPINVQRAIAALVEVRALTPTEDITPMGRLLSKLPTDVHLGKFLLTAVVFRCLDPALTIAASLNSKSPFITPLGLELEADRAKNAFRVDNSDFLTIHNAFASWRRASANSGFVRKFCRKNFLSHENLLQIEELRQQFLGYLVDSSFIDVDMSFVKELSRVRFERNKSRFVMVPPELDSNSGNFAIINAALLSGLYPKLLCVDPTSGLQMRTLSNNQTAFFHPSSVNFRRKPKDLAANYLAYFTLMHSKKLYAWETGPMDDLAILLLCGECDFKLMSDVAIVDRKIKYRLTFRANVAMKILRNQLSSISAQKFRGKPMTESQVRWHELGMAALGKVKLDAEADSSGASVKLVIRS
ncbi:P-loop containing nucleoside triphosphate hydrolase protein [Paxillus ammoniavirescens]|nr:P-loop containing nucleoside triphosphate hydrolase protein [Paxillus ammoniavirescens]